MPRSILTVVFASLLAAGAVLSVGRTPRAGSEAVSIYAAEEYPSARTNDWRTVLVVNTKAMVYHRAIDGCYPSTALSRDNALFITDTRVRHAREQVEKLGCRPCELCFK